MRDLVFRFVSGKSLNAYQMVAHVGQLPPNTRAILGIHDWQNVFRPSQDGGWFKGEDLGCELVEVIGPEPANETNIDLKSLSSEFLLIGLTSEGRIEPLIEGLVAHQLKIKYTGNRVMTVSFGWGPVITGRSV